MVGMTLTYKICLLKTGICFVPVLKLVIYSQTSMAGTHWDRLYEIDPSMGSSDTGTDNFQGSSCVLKYVYHGHHFFINQSF